MTSPEAGPPPNGLRADSTSPDMPSSSDERLVDDAASDAMARLALKSDPVPNMATTSKSAPIIAPASPIRARDFALEPNPTGPGRPAGPAPLVIMAAGSPIPQRASTSNLGALRAQQAGGNVKLPPSLQAKMAALANRTGKSGSPAPTSMSATDRLDATALLGSSPTAQALASSSGASPVGSRDGSPSPPPSSQNGIAKRRGPGMNLSQIGMGIGSAAPTGRMSANGPVAGPSSKPPSGGRRPAPGGLRLNHDDMGGGTPFANFNRIVDPSGKLNFDKKAVLHAKGVDFSNGSSFSINMDELQLLGELGKGNYGTVQRVFHKVTKVTMAMKEIRLELDDGKLKTIITELDILHRSTAPEIVDFYGAFFVESCVYYCMEFMDAGSLEQLQGFRVPEDVLGRVTASMVRGLKFLKDELQTMHRDVKPTNVLVNRAGAIKLCDFGVSGQLERSLAKTNIGCQSYMAPERIKGESQGQVSTYTVSSDVWSLGLSIIEFTLGHYPYPPETYPEALAQLQAIVHGEPPKLAGGYSRDANDFVARCLRKIPHSRPSYAELLAHPFLVADANREVNMVAWVEDALKARAERLSPASTVPSSAPTASTSP